MEEVNVYCVNYQFCLKPMANARFSANPIRQRGQAAGERDSVCFLPFSNPSGVKYHVQKNLDSQRR